MEPNHALLSILDQFHGTRVAVMGDVMLDRFIYGSVERISPEAPIPVLSIEKQSDMPGGAANVVRNVTAMGANATLVGVVGSDPYAADLAAQVAKDPNTTVTLIKDPSRPTTVKTRFVAERQQVMRADRESRTPLSERVANKVISAFVAALDEADIAVLSDYAKGVLSASTTAAAIQAARARGTVVVVDPKSSSFEKYRGATILTPNRHELELACGHACASDEQVVAGASKLIADAICDVMVVTRGPQGMSIISSDGRAVHMRATAREVYDVSGAGDTVIATLALAVAAGAGIETACRLANVAAGLVVAKIGTAAVSTVEIATALALNTSSSNSSKIFSLEHAMRLADGWRARGLKVAFTNGCFDLLHPGHVSLLEQAHGSADRLIVGLNSDLSVRRLKGPARPIQSEVARATVIAALRQVDAVVIFSGDTPIELIECLRPDVLVKGADYSVDQVVGADLVQRHGGRVVLAAIVDGQSTSSTIAKLATSSTPRPAETPAASVQPA